MPEENETTTQAEGSEQAADTGADETTETGEDTSAAGGEGAGDGGSGSDDTAQEAEKTDDKAAKFDQKKFEAELRKKNNEAANLRKRLKELEPQAAELQRIKDSEKSETERLNDQLERANAQIAATRKRLVTSRVQALASSPDGERAAFADPEDAIGQLDLNSYLDSDGEIDEAAISADLAALLERKPHWAKAQAQAQEGPRRPAPDRTQASGAKSTKTLTPQDEFQGWLKAQLH